MKTIFKQLGISLAFVMLSVLLPKTVAAQQDYVDLQIFYDELSPYGHWIDHPKYGYAWIPDEGADFMPYSTRGQWIYTDYGWTWVSEYSWGWAPFHYGRWDYDAYYGWLWVPDYDWGPSWVTWRRAGGYYGWQPMRPGININFSFGNDYYNSYNNNWMFVRDRDFQKPNVGRYHLNQVTSDRIIRNSTVINNTYIDNRRNTTYVSGPNREDLQRLTGKSVRSVPIQEATQPGQTFDKKQLRIYRPQVQNTNNQDRKPTPNKITNSEDVKRHTTRNNTNQPPKASPVGDIKRENIQDNVKQQNNKQIEQPVRQQMNENSQDNRREPERNQATPPIKDESKTKQELAPTEIKDRRMQQDVADPQNNRMKDQPSKPNVQPTETRRQQLQQKAATPQNNKRNNRQSRESKAKSNKRQNN